MRLKVEIRQCFLLSDIWNNGCVVQSLDWSNYLVLFGTVCHIIADVCRFALLCLITAFHTFRDKYMYMKMYNIFEEIFFIRWTQSIWELECDAMHSKYVCCDAFFRKVWFYKKQNILRNCLSFSQCLSVTLHIRHRFIVGSQCRTQQYRAEQSSYYYSSAKLSYLRESRPR